MPAALPIIDVPDSVASLDAALANEARLADWLRDAGSVLVGYSGGVDSAYLAVVARDALGPTNVLAVIGRSASYPAEQWRGAREVADAFDVLVLEVETDELNDPRYAANPSNRCYYCKTELWSHLVPVAHARGLAVVVDGTNADDLTERRPGARAAAECDVRSPLAEVGLTKAEIRLLSRRRGLPTWAQPSSPCLSSRLPYGTPVTAERLARVERAERALRERGLRGDLRVRDHGDVARIEVTAADLDALVADGGVPAAVRAAGFDRVAIDLHGFRSGSLDVLGGVRAEGAVSDAADAASLAAALRAEGLASDVEARDRLALVSDASATRQYGDGAVRERTMRLAHAHGFTHAAVLVP